MKATELMIGNWVKIKGDYGKPLKITTIDDTYNSINYFDGDAEGELTLQLNEIEPVPITREILEKNEFAYCERNGAFYAYAEESYSNQTVEIILFNVESEYRNNQLHINEANYKGKTMIHLMECNYVHNLQHVFRVCGIKKEIVL